MKMHLRESRTLKFSGGTCPRTPLGLNTLRAFGKYTRLLLLSTRLRKNLLKPLYFDLNIWFRVRKNTGTFEKRALRSPAYRFLVAKGQKLLSSCPLDKHYIKFYCQKPKSSCPKILLKTRNSKTNRAFKVFNHIISLVNNVLEWLEC